MKNKKLYNYLPNLIISLFLAFIFLALSLLFAADNIFFEPTTYTDSMHKIKSRTRLSRRYRHIVNNNMPTLVLKLIP